MGALPSISVDSLGNRGSTALGFPPLRDDPGTPADRQQVVRVVEGWRRDAVGQTTDNAHQMAQSFTSGVYIAVNTIMTAMSGATVQVLQRKRGRLSKSQSASAAGSQESEWAPVEHDHEIARLFATPNERDTTSDFLAEYVMCRSLFGMGALLWNPGKGTKKPVDLWNLRRNWMQTRGGASIDYPRGNVYYSPPMPTLWGVGGAGSSVPFPRERLVIHRRPHPLFPWDAYSPLTGGAKLVDFLNAVIDSRQMAMDKGLSVDVIVALTSANPKAIEDFDSRIKEKYTGSNRGQKFAVVDGERVDIKPLGNTPDKMAYADSYTHGIAAVLALFGVPAVCAFLADADYSGFYAAARAWREGNIGGECNSIGQRWTKDLIRPHWGDDFKLEIKLPPLMDPEQKERQWATLTSATSGVTFLVNELRASFDMKPIDGGDVTPAEFAAKLQKANQPQQPGAGSLPHPSPFGGQPDELAQLPGGDPNAEPFAPGDLDNPEIGDASAGSLPGAVRKAVDLESYFAQLVEEVCA